MANLNTQTHPVNIAEVTSKFPKTMSYFMTKGATSISITGYYLSLNCSITGYCLVYDFQDLELFEKAL